MSTANDFPRELMLALTIDDATRLFRNNVGLGWTGKAIHMKDGSVLIENARPLHAGLIKGSSDLIGWRSIVVQPHHLGMRLAVFAALEAKTGSGRSSTEQRSFIEAVRRAGGVAGVARSVTEASGLLASVG